MPTFSWTATSGGDWNTPADWNVGSVPSGTTDAVFFTDPGAYTVDISYGEAFSVDSMTLDAAGVTLDIHGALTVGGVNHTLTLDAGTLELDRNGTIIAGTIAAAGGTLFANGGTLEGVTYEGTLDLSATYSDLHITDGITLTGTNGTGQGAINLTGYEVALYIDNTTTLNNATIYFGTNSYPATSSISVNDPNATGNQLTLGSNLTLSQVGAYASLYGDSSPGDGIVNDGTIDASVSGGQFTVAGNFSNAGSIAVSGGDSFIINNTTFTNTGTLTETGGSTVTLNTDWTNAGHISETDSTLNLGGTFTTAALDTIGASGGEIDITGTLINTGATLDVGPGSALGTVTLSGTIVGGVIHDAGSGLLGNFGTLEGVTYEGTLDLSSSSGAAVQIVNGITLTGVGGTGSGTVNLTGHYSSFTIDNTTTLNNATIDIGNNESGVYSILEIQDTSGTGAVLTLGKTLALVQVGSAILATYNNDPGDGIVNQGTISAGVEGGNFAIQGESFTNQGSIAVSDGDTLTIGSTTWTNTGSISETDSTLNLGGLFAAAALNKVSASGGAINIIGTLINTGATLDVGPGSPLGTVTVSGGTIVGGVIHDAGSGLVSNNGTLEGVTYEGALGLTAQSAYWTIVNGITLTGTGGTGAGTVNLTGIGAQLYIDNTTTLNNATIDIGSSSNSYLYSDDTTGTGAVLTFGSTLTLTQAGALASLVTYNNFTGDGIVNDGTIDAGFSGGQFTVSGNSFTNNGSIIVSGGDTFIIQSTTLTNASGATLTGGSYEVDANSTLQLINNELVVTDDADIILSGTASVIDAYDTTTSTYITLDAKLTTIGTTGTLALLDGRAFTTASTFTNKGLLNLGGAVFGSGAFGNASGAKIIGFGTINAALTNTGSMEADGGLLKLASTVAGTGGFTVDAGATLEFAKSPASGQAITFNGLDATLRIDTPASFAGTVAAFSPGDTIDLAGITTATGAVISGNTLTVSLSGGSTLTYAVSTPYAGDHLKVASDGNGGTDVIAYGLALPGPYTPDPVSLGDAHVGAVATQALSLTNTAPTNGYYETLDASIGGATAGVTASGSFTLLAPGATDSSDLIAGLNTSSDGDKVGTDTITLTSDGTGVDGLGTTAIGTQTVTITGAVFNYATASAASPNPVNFGEHHVGSTLSQALSISNLGTADGFTENLDASISGATGSASASGSFTGLAAGISNNSALTVGLNSGTAGVQAGTAKVTLTSDGAGIDTLGTTALTAQTITVEGTLYNYATASAASPNPVNFGERHVGSTLSQALSIGNTGATGGFTENLDASIGSATGSASASGSFTGLAAGVSNSSALTVSLNSGTAGVQSGSATVTLTSDGTGIDTLGTTALTAQTITVEGTLYNYATASAVSPNPVNFGERHVGSTLSQALSIGNLGTADGYTENLDASIGSATGSASASGSFTGLAAGVSNSSNLVVGLNSGTAGVQSGSATVTLTSDGTGIDTLGTTALASETITVAGTLYNYATASAASPNPVNFGEHHVGSTLSQALSIGNTGATGGFTENLDASIGNATGSVTASGSFSGLAAGDTNSSGLTIDLNSATAGVQTGTAKVTLISDGTGIDTLGTTALASETITVAGTLYNYATASAASPNPVNFGERHVGSTLSQALSIGNTGSAGSFTENLNASIGSATGSVTASGSVTDLVAGGTNSSGLIVGLNSGTAGVQTGTAKVTLTSDGTGIDTLGTTALTAQTITVEGTLYNYATASAASPNPVNFGEHHVGSTLSQALSISNTGSAGSFTENLDASIGNATGSASASGSVTGLAAGASNSSALTVGLNSGTAGVQTGTAKVTLTSDGTGIDTLGTTALASETITVAGTLYNYAIASVSPEPVNFGEHHVGSTLSQALSIGNTGSAGSFTENLDASIGNATGSVTASGSFAGLVAGGANSSALTIALNSGKAGVQSGSATVTLTSDGAGIDTLGTTALTSQTIAVSGTLYNYATASAASPDPVNFGERHVGSTLSQALSISNSGATGGFTENLDARISGATGSANVNGSFAGLAAGGTNSSGLTIGLNSGTAGVQSGSATVTLTSDGAGIDTLGTTALTAQTITVEGTLYNYATASAVSPNPVNFGIVHVGATVSEALSISNTGSAGSFTETLDGSVGSATGSVTAGGSFSGLAASATNTSALSVGVNTATAGTISGTATIKLTSDGTGIDTLGTTALTSQTVTVDAIVNNYATAVVEDLSGGGVLTQTGTTYTLALGTIDLDTSAPEIDLGIGNAASGPADLLSGGFVVSGDGGVAFTNTLTSFSGVAAGGVASAEGISLSTSTGGVFSEQITLVATGTNSSGYLGALPDEVITVTGTVVLPPRTLVWTGAGDTNFANAANWDDRTLGLDPATLPPSAKDTTEFNGIGGGITGTGIAAALSFGAGAWHLATGGSLTATGSVTVGTSQDATLLIDDGSSLVTGGGAVIADQSDASGSSVTVTGSGSNWQVGGSFAVGDAATGQLSIDAGATVTAATLNAGVLSGSAGIVTVTGSNTDLTTTGSLSIGDGGSGELSILNGANVFIGGDLDIGQTTGGSGNVDIEDTTGTIYIGGNLNVGAGGPGGLVIGPNATVELDNGGENIGADAAVTLFSLFDPTELNNASLNTAFSVSGTQTYKAYVNNTGAITIDSGFSIALDTPVIYGAGGAFNIDAGFTLVLNTDTVTGQTINFNGSGTLVIGSDQSPTIDVPASGTGPFTSETNPNYGDALIGNFGGTINNFVAGDVITVDTTGPATFSQNGATVSVIENGSTVGVLTFATPEMAQTAATTSDALLDNALCFLAGTMIATPAGETVVERLAVGDLVLTVGGQVRPIVWVGQGRVLATKGRRNAATPVIVRKGALGPNVPRADLRVTKGHSLFIDDVLIPVEFLVNHRSIQWDDRAQEVSVYHVELETHDVLVANGAAAESYRDDGNRWLFGNANSGWDQPAKPPCAPVLTGGPVVDAAWRRLLDRAGPRPGMPLTADPDLHLVVDGVRVDAQKQQGTLYMFRLPNRPTSVAIASRAGVPAELGIVRDPRSLGVAVKQVAVRQGAKFMQLDADDERLTTGFHEFEQADGLRWTTGYAELPAETFTKFDNGAEVMLYLAGSTHYIEDDNSRAFA
ncbi:choice-of-anchor D domain-containing protein [Acidisphaera sp. S103]|uniref:choice-of-anchor D domain-containing protein n=1 Tax=Acidisphaera sp. S103 TaxID=1747223 RepID=UPI00131DBA22|nr:choice-of-anchor D domain-containing protein [Acidisphaera sp. S103]